MTQSSKRCRAIRNYILFASTFVITRFNLSANVKMDKKSSNAETLIFFLIKHNSFWHICNYLVGLWKKHDMNVVLPTYQFLPSNTMLFHTLPIHQIYHFVIFLFSKMKLKLKRQRFTTIEQIQTNRRQCLR